MDAGALEELLLLLLLPTLVKISCSISITFVANWPVVGPWFG
jgi:hypothetical protein